jgi:hypothetical protein
MYKEAVISDDEVYRYTLYREWTDDPGFEGVRVLNFVMLNPSTADAEKDDPTIRKCIGFAKLSGHNAIRVVNLFAYRATKPVDLWRQYESGTNIAGPLNDAYVRELPPEETVCVAWGSTYMNKDWTQRRVLETTKLLNRKLWCLGRTKDGHPNHPVMLGYGPLIEF